MCKLFKVELNGMIACCKLNLEVGNVVFATWGVWEADPTWMYEHKTCHGKIGLEQWF